MKNKDFSTKKNSNKKFNILIYVVSFFLVLSLTISYAALNQDLKISGEAKFEVEKDARIVMATFSEAAYGVQNYNPRFTKDTLSTSVTLSQLNGTVSYTITLRNLGNVDMNIISSSFIESDNSYITYELSEDYPIAIKEGVTNKQITVTFKYKDGISELPNNTTLVSTIKFDITDVVDMCTKFTIKENYSVGDVIAICNSSTGKSEDFYVISDNGSTVTALAKYNLLVGNMSERSLNSPYTYTLTPIPSTDPEYGIQSSKTTPDLQNYIYNGVMAFADKNNDNDYAYWVNENGKILSKYGSYLPAYVFDDNSNLWVPVQDYQTYLRSLGKTSATLSLLNYNQAINLGCSDDEETCYGYAQAWVYSTDYWLGTATGSTDILNICSDGYFDHVTPFYDNRYIGIRPIITIDKSDL